MRAASKPKRGPSKPALLAGGNPQVAKADGDAPVQAYLAAMPGWKSAVGRRLDALIVRTLPGVRKAVKWNSPFYGGAALIVDPAGRRPPWLGRSFPAVAGWIWSVGEVV
jgi:hypothetical protein